MIKLYAIDLDDTFLDKKDIMSEKNKEAVKDLLEAGVKVILNSGRSEVLMREHTEELNLYDFRHVAINGALILGREKDNEPNELISKFDKDTYEQFIDTLREEKRHFFVYTKDGLIYENPNETLISHIQRYHTMKAAVEGDSKNTDGCCRVAVLRDNEEDVPHLRDICPKNAYTTARPFGHCVSYMPLGINKASGLKLIMDEYNIVSDEVASIGDQEVDTYMFDISKMSFAVSNSDEKTKKRATHVLPRSNNENAFAYSVYKYILKNEKKLKEV